MTPRSFGLLFGMVFLGMAGWWLGSGLTGRVAAEDTAVSAFVPVLPEVPFNYSPTLPPHYTAPPVQDTDNTPVNNPVTNEGATLGRVLFYDKLLSANQTISCASCHQQANGFSDPATLSIGFEGGETGRNSMGLANARYYNNGRFFWDERAATLEDQVLMPIQDGVEMGLTLEQLVTRVAAQSYYPALFEDAFGTAEVTSERISLALAQFVRSMVNTQSKYDQGLAAQPIFSNFTPQENLGLRVFRDPLRGNCLACHGTEPAFVAPGARNNGLDLVTAEDEGAGNGRFKVNSLRNIALTAPYMHDGRFQTLTEVVTFYNSGIQNHANLDPALRDPNTQMPRQFYLTAEEQAALVAFLNTLTDPTFATDPRFADPFVEVAGPTIFLPLITR